MKKLGSILRVYWFVLGMAFLSSACLAQVQPDESAKMVTGAPEAPALDSPDASKVPS